MTGLDLSEHNGQVDFTKLKEQGIEFVILRIGWIGNKNNHTIDKKFEEYYNNAKSVGLKIGIYVYNYCKSVEAIKSGVNWIIEKMNNRTIEMPIFLDMEDSSIKDCNNLTLLCVEFCNLIKQTKYKSGVYANKDWFTNYINVNSLKDNKIWLAEWNVNNPSVNFKVNLWQYTSDGKYNGINGRVDVNKCLDCEENKNIEEITGGSDEEVKEYYNGSTIENVYADTNLTKKIGYLGRYESCECLGIFNNRPMVRYKVDNQNNYKIGFVEWLGGVK